MYASLYGDSVPGGFIHGLGDDEVREWLFEDRQVNMSAKMLDSGSLSFHVALSSKLPVVAPAVEYNAEPVIFKAYRKHNRVFCLNVFEKITDDGVVTTIKEPMVIELDAHRHQLRAYSRHVERNQTTVRLMSVDRELAFHAYDSTSGGRDLTHRSSSRIFLDCQSCSKRSEPCECPTEVRYTRNMRTYFPSYTDDPWKIVGNILCAQSGRGITVLSYPMTSLRTSFTIKTDGGHQLLARALLKNTLASYLNFEQLQPLEPPMENMSPPNTASSGKSSEDSSESGDQKIAPVPEPEILQRRERSMLSCTLCSASFRRPYGLRRHMDGVHRQKKQWKCEWCSMRFSQNAHLLSHVRTIHTEGKTFKCHLCQKSYSWKTNLNRHLRRGHKLRVGITDSNSIESDRN
mmetsp:Transcript_7185/g.21922  ORF Transcript_7185/g.21922 Transcript_7185/m.21922 type:complete len:403 (+) Transcript_7185:377-1585(+)